MTQRKRLAKDIRDLEAARAPLLGAAISILLALVVGALMWWLA